MRRSPQYARIVTVEARRVAGLAVVLLAVACGSREPAPAVPVSPWILLVTLDTTRADAVGPDAPQVETPAFDALAARGRRYTQAYATAPETLPSHGSMMTGLYPAGHGVHENARHLAASHPLAAERLRQAGYRTAAFVSSFVLSRRFGLARGFDAYDDEMPAARSERPARETTDRALAYLAQPGEQPLLLWVHYFDPHAPYAPEEPFRGRYAASPYHGEVAAMDEQLGRLVRAFEERAGRAGRSAAIVVAGDHGEGLGDHGEPQHGNLVYQSTMHVPLLVAGPGVDAGVSDTPVSTRRIFHTLLDWAGLGATDSLRGSRDEVVLGEAMRPYLNYGWQPQIMAVSGRQKVIFAKRFEVYDVVADPGETRDLAARASVPAEVRTALDEYPVPAVGATRAGEGLTDEARRSLASLGYVGATARPVVRRDAPRPIDMAHLFERLDTASGLFVREQYAEVIPLLERILAEDPFNLDAALRLATAHSSLGQEAQALAAFRRAATIAPDSQDVRTYLALHYARGRDWARAVPMLERIVAEAPERVPALEALAVVRERQGRIAEAIALRQKIYGMRAPSPAELVQLGRLAMGARQTPLAIESFERARAMQGAAFAQDLELGVLYLAARRLEEAKGALERVPASHPEYPMALFKRAQVSVLLNEPDRASRIEQARRHADRTTRELIARERLFQDARGR
jgi:arylsulfatase A-like enzyme/tetratricopeptide (TPR) repeat protein